MRSPLATRKQYVKKDISIQYGAHGIYGNIDILDGLSYLEGLDALTSAFDKALQERRNTALAQAVKEIMAVEPSTEDLNIRTLSEGEDQ